MTEEGLRTRWWVGANLGNHSGRLKDVRAVHVSTAEEAGVEAVCYLQFFLEWTAAKKEKQCTSHLSLSLSTFVPIQMSIWNLIVLGSWPSSWPQGMMLLCGLEYSHLFVSSQEAAV